MEKYNVFLVVIKVFLDENKNFLHNGKDECILGENLSAKGVQSFINNNTGLIEGNDCAMVKINPYFNKVVSCNVIKRIY